MRVIPASNRKSSGTSDKSAIQNAAFKPCNNHSLQDTMLHLAQSFQLHFDTEMAERKKFILYLKIMLPSTALFPFLIVATLIGCGVITGDVEGIVALIIATLTVPAGIIGVFKVISSKLFEDKYRRELLNLWIEQMTCKD